MPQAPASVATGDVSFSALGSLYHLKTHFEIIQTYRSWRVTFLDKHHLGCDLGKRVLSSCCHHWDSSTHLKPSRCSSVSLILGPGLKIISAHWATHGDTDQLCPAGHKHPTKGSPCHQKPAASTVDVPWPFPKWSSSFSHQFHLFFPLLLYSSLFMSQLTANNWSLPALKLFFMYS